MLDPEDRRERLLERTLEVWQPKTSCELTHEDTRVILEDMVGFFDILLKWDALERCSEDIGALPGKDLVDETRSTDA